MKRNTIKTGVFCQKCGKQLTVKELNVIDASFFYYPCKAHISAYKKSFKAFMLLHGSKLTNSNYTVPEDHWERFKNFTFHETNNP